MKALDQLPRQPVVGLALAAIFGIAAANYFPVYSEISAVTAVVCSAGLAIALRLSPATYAFVAVTLFAIHSLRVTDSTGQRLAQQLGDASSAITARGYVTTEPKISPGGTATFILSLKSVKIDDVVHDSRGKMFVRWKHAVEFGDEINLFGTAEPVPPPRNPGEFDMRAQLARQDVYRQLIVGYAENGAVLRHRTGNLILRTAERSRNWLQHVLTRGLEDSPDIETMINGMVLGLRHQTPADIEEPFQQTGTLHLFAVAGLHVGIVAQLLWILAAVARLSRKWTTALVIPALFFYAAVTGLHTSSVRAAVMSAVLLSGFFVERKVFALNSLATAAMLILAWNTNELFSVGFQLSFAVVATIIILAGPAFRFLRRHLQQDPFLPRSLFTRTRRVVERLSWWIARGASVSFAAWLGSLPLMLYYYHLITPISLLANLAVVPIAFFVLAGALISVACAPFSTWLSVVFNNTNWLLGRIILALVHLFAQLPAGHLYVEQPHWPTGAAVELTALDVGTGAAIHLRTARTDWLFDAGGRRDFDRTVQPYLRSRGVNRLDGLLLTHGDAGHIGGAADVLGLFVPPVVIDAGGRDRSAAHRDFLAQLATDRAAHRVCSAGDEWKLSRDVSARVLFPPRDFQAASADDRAVVVQILVKSRPRVLLMSDSGETTERALLENGANLQTDVLIKGQHRSGLSGLPEFLDAVKPQLIIATSRDFPQTERIKDEWAEMVNARGIHLLRQDQAGAVQLRIFRNRVEARPYLGPEIFRSTSR
jgi:competence protein ComEC